MFPAKTLSQKCAEDRPILNSRCQTGKGQVAGGRRQLGPALATAGSVFGEVGLISIGSECYRQSPRSKTNTRCRPRRTSPRPSTSAQVMPPLFQNGIIRAGKRATWVNAR